MNTLNAVRHQTHLGRCMRITPRQGDNRLGSLYNTFRNEVPGRKMVWLVLRLGYWLSYLRTNPFPLTRVETTRGPDKPAPSLEVALSAHDKSPREYMKLASHSYLLGHPPVCTIFTKCRRSSMIHGWAPCLLCYKLQAFLVGGALYLSSMGRISARVLRLRYVSLCALSGIY